MDPRTEQYPKELFEGLTNKDEFERRARCARFLVLTEMGFFKEPANIVMSKTPEEGTWTAAVRRRFSGRYGDVSGCHPADIEVAAEMLGVFDEIYDMEYPEEQLRIDEDDGA